MTTPLFSAFTTHKRADSTVAAIETRCAFRPTHSTAVEKTMMVVGDKQASWGHRAQVAAGANHARHDVQRRVRHVRHDAIGETFSTLALKKLTSHVACKVGRGCDRCVVTDACGARLRERRGVRCVNGAGEQRRAVGGAGASAGCTPHCVRLRISEDGSAAVPRGDF